MKIGLVTSYDYSHPGGVINHISCLAHYLLMMGHDVKIMAPVRRRGTRYFEEEVRAIGRPLPIPYGGTTARIPLAPWLPYQVRRVLDKEKFDIVHLHEPFIPMLCLSTLSQSQSTNVGTFHACHERSGLYWLSQPILRRLGKKLDGKIAVSQPALKYISRYLPAAYRVIPNAVDTNHYKPEGPVRHELRNGKLNILFVGRLEERKGISDLIHACAIVKKDFPNFRLIIAGPGIKLRYQYESLARRLIPDQAIFTGFIPFDKLPEYYRTADIFCAPATGGESFGIVLLEAMATGTPVVATDIPGYSSVVTHGHDGLLAKTRDRFSIAESLLSLIHDKSLRLKIAENGMETAERHSWQNVSRKIADYYKFLVG